MPAYSTYKSSATWSILLLGPPGTGKTSLAAQIGTPLIVDLDGNVGAAFNYLRSKGLPCRAFYVEPLKDKDGGLVPRGQRYLRMVELIKAELAANPQIDTIVLDSLTTLNETIIDEVRRQQKMKIGSDGQPDDKMEIQHWGMIGGLYRELMIRLRAGSRNLIAIGHPIVEKEDLNEAVKRLFINVPGRFSSEIAGLFQEVWFLSVEQQLVNGKFEHTHMMTTRPSSAETHLGLKSSHQLPAKSPVDIEKLNNLLFPKV